MLFGRDSGTDLIRPEGFPGRRQLSARALGRRRPGYFSTMGIRLVAGRDFTEQDNESSPRVIAINETMAQRLFPGANPIGRRLVGAIPTSQISRSLPLRAM